MGEVLSFSLRSTPAASEALPEWRRALRDQFWSPSGWRTSARGNPYCRIAVGGAEHCCTVFRRTGGWRWCIATDAQHAPLWSDGVYDTMSDARAHAFDALLALAAPKQA